MSIQFLRRTGRWSILAAAALAMPSLSVFGQSSTTPLLRSLGQAANTSSDPCSSGSASFIDAEDVITVPSPFSVLFHAATAKGCTITAVRLYVDNRAYRTYSVHQPGGTVGGSNFPDISLPTGYHTFVCVAWNQAGYAFTTQRLRVFVADQASTVYINSPKDGATVTGPIVDVDVRARWDSPGEGSGANQIVRMRVYMDNVIFSDTYNSKLTYLNFSVRLASGQHHLVVIAWNHQGEYIKGSSTFTVK